MKKFLVIFFYLMFLRVAERAFAEETNGGYCAPRLRVLGKSSIDESSILEFVTSSIADVNLILSGFMKKPSPTEWDIYEVSDEAQVSLGRLDDGRWGFKILVAYRRSQTADAVGSRATLMHEYAHAYMYQNLVFIQEGRRLSIAASASETETSIQALALQIEELNRKISQLAEYVGTVEDRYNQALLDELTDPSDPFQESPPSSWKPFVSRHSISLTERARFIQEQEELLEKILRLQKEEKELRATQYERRGQTDDLAELWADFIPALITENLASITESILHESDVDNRRRHYERARGFDETEFVGDAFALSDAYYRLHFVRSFLGQELRKSFGNREAKTKLAQATWRGLQRELDFRLANKESEAVVKTKAEIELQLKDEALGFSAAPEDSIYNPGSRLSQLQAEFTRVDNMRLIGFIQDELNR